MSHFDLFYKEFRFVNGHRLDVEQSSSQPRLVEITTYGHKMEPLLVDMNRANVNELIKTLEQARDRLPEEE